MKLRRTGETFAAPFTLEDGNVKVAVDGGSGSVSLVENGIAVLEFQKQRAQVRPQEH
jgi:hypothetical protein